VGRGGRLRRCIARRLEARGNGLGAEPRFQLFEFVPCRYPMTYQTSATDTIFMLTFQVTTWVNTQPAAIRPVKLYPMLSLWGRRPLATFDAAVDHVDSHAKAG
jgi:hypothetical protein